MQQSGEEIRQLPNDGRAEKTEYKCSERNECALAAFLLSGFERVRECENRALNVCGLFLCGFKSKAAERGSNLADDNFVLVASGALFEVRAKRGFAR